jgi:hypothetical protein
MTGTSTALYVGGVQHILFSMRRAKPFLRAFDARTGRDLGWKLRMRGRHDVLAPPDNKPPQVSALAVRGNLLYVAGLFTHLDGTARRNFAVIRRSDQYVTALRRDPPFGVTSMAVARRAVYLVANGLQTVRTAGPVARVRVRDHDQIQQILSAAGHLYVTVTDLYHKVGNVHPIREFTESTGRPTRWNPRFNASVSALAAAPDDTVVVGGRFTVAGGVAQRGLAIFRPRHRHQRPVHRPERDGNL